MEALGQAVGGIAHDFNNILAVALGYTQLMLLRAPDPNAPELKPVRNIDAAAHKAKDLIEKMLSFARGSSDKATQIQLSRKLKEFSQFIAPLLPAGIELEIAHIDDDLQLLIAETSLDQILLNLVINARDAIGDKGTIHLKAVHTSGDQGYCQSCGQAIDANYVQLTVKDNGSGFDGIRTDEIFQPFYSTKETGKGSGMGLSVVHGLLHGIGGHIQAHSLTEGGAEFRAYIPTQQSSANSSSQDTASNLPKLDQNNDLQQITLVIIDDEEAISTMLSEFFSLFGANIISYNSAPDFLYDLEKPDFKFDMVLTDITMPRVSGIEVCERIRNKRSTKVIAMSGYNETISPSSFSEFGFDGFLNKPIDMKKAIELVRQLIATINHS